MTSVAVVAHQRKSLGGGLDELRSIAGPRGRSSRSGTRCPKSKKAPELRPRGGREGRRPRLRVGRRRHGAALHRRPGRHRRDRRHPPGRHRQPVRHQPRHPEGPRRGRRHRAARRHRPLDVGRDQRRALRGDGRHRLRRRDDPGRRPRPEGQGRPARLRVDRRQEPQHLPRCSMRVRVDGDDWFEGKASCVLFGNVGTVSGGFTAFDDAEPDDGVLEVGVVTAKGAGAVVAGARPPGRRAGSSGRRSPARPRPATIDVRLGRQAALRARRRRPQGRPSGSRSRSSRAAITRLRAATGGGRREHRHARPRDLGAHRRRRRGRRCAHTGRRRLLRDAFVRLRVADGFSHARSLAFMTSLVLVQAHHRAGRPRQRAGRQPHRQHGIVSTIQSAVPGPAGQVLTAAVDQAHNAGVSRRYLALALGLVGPLVVGHHRHGPARAGPQPHLRRRAGPAEPQKYGLGLLLAVSAGTLTGVAFVAVGFGSAVGDSLHNDDRRPAWDDRCAGRSSLGRHDGGHGAAVPLVPPPAPARRGRWLAVRRRPSRCCCGSSSPLGLGAVLPREPLVRRHLRAARRHRRPAAVVRCCRPWRSSSAARSPPSSKRCRAGQPRPQDEEKVEHSEPDAEPSRCPTVPARPRDRASTRRRRGDRPGADGDGPTTHRRGSGVTSRASSACPPPRATASTCCATATRSSPPCSTPSTRPSTPSTS